MATSCIYDGPEPKSVNPRFEDHAHDGIICLLNGERKKRIFRKYLTSLGSNVADYKLVFPNAPLICEATRLKYAEKTQNRVQTRKATMRRLNGEGSFQAKRLTGFNAFWLSADSDTLRSKLSDKAKKQHANGLQGIIREKFWITERMKVFNRKRSFSFQEFCFRAQAIHGNRFTYVGDTYRGAKSHTQIICQNHGSFWQIGASHLRGTACPRCAGFVSKKETAWLDSIKIPERQKKIQIKSKRKFTIVDGYDKDTNTVYLFHGNFWHGNPAIFRLDDWNDLTKCTYGELYQRTLRMENRIREMGHNLIVMWERDFDIKRRNQNRMLRRTNSRDY